jgi:exonuclease III
VAKDFQIIALQEHSSNPKDGDRIYSPPNYTQASRIKAMSRVAFLIYNKIPMNDWTTQEYGQDVERLRLRTEIGWVNIINVYNPGGDDGKPVISSWEAIKNAIIDSKEEEIVLLGDFNIHHPKWQPGSDRKESGDHILRKTGEKGLQLITEQGITTWRRGTQETVIDLTFTTAEVAHRLTACQPREDWTARDDHIPIGIEIDLTVALKPAEGRFNTRKADWDGIREDLEKANWEHGSPGEALYNLQILAQELLKQHCPRTRASDRSRSDWSPEATQWLSQTRTAKNRFRRTHLVEDEKEWKHQANRLKRETDRMRRANWRRFIQQIDSNPDDAGSAHNAQLWRMAKWARGRGKASMGPPKVPPLRLTKDHPYEALEDGMAAVLHQGLFPETGIADLSDIDNTEWQRFNLDPEINPQEMERTLRTLPRGKAPGPDEIPNELWIELSKTLATQLARVTTALFREGEIPGSLKDTITIVLKKEQKKDYSLPKSWRPIALENTLAKVIEKVLAGKISIAAEERNLLPWNQMGARKQRSTLSAVELLTSAIETAWGAKQPIVSVLGLDLAGAFDNVSWERLLWLLRKKGFPEWTVKLVHSFLTGRRTSFAFNDSRSDWYKTATGIPQGSTLSPILFLFFISELLEEFQEVDKGLLGFGFVDDTTLIAWGRSATENCRRLTEAHDKCISWARRYGARFAPDKYQLIHFTKKKKVSEDLLATVEIGNEKAELVRELRVLGVWLDPKLSWTTHIKKSAEKGLAAFNAIARITASTWGPSVRRSRLLYTAIARPIITYGSQIWAAKGASGPQRSTWLDPIRKTQNKCLRRAMGAYRRTGTHMVERESDTIPLPLYIDALAAQRVIKAQDHLVTAQIDHAVSRIHRDCEKRSRKPGKGRRARIPRRQETTQDILRERANRLVLLQQRNDTPGQRGGEGHRRRPEKLIQEYYMGKWRSKWEVEAMKPGRREATWKDPWVTKPLRLYEKLAKHEATALFLLRTEVIGLNDWLARAKVPDVDPLCPCGEYRQTVDHILHYCSRLREPRATLQAITGKLRPGDALGDAETARTVARWFIKTGILGQFRTAKEIQEEDTTEWAAPAPLRRARGEVADQHIYRYSSLE